jgi:hypothetical protein
MIVSLTRGDLRDEIVMATEAFALSPMSARAAEPNEQDYDAIREAFMETARGRWFLGEYAKRNRNADTSMVLSAVARIEETLAAQRQPVVEDRLPEALIAIRRAIREAETSAIAAADPAAVEASLSPVSRAVRIIKEISWRWREIGADGRICDLIDSQLQAIEAACGQISTIDPRTELKAAFDLLRDRIEQTEAGEASSPQAEAQPVTEEPVAAVAEASAAMPEMPQEVAGAVETVVEAVGGIEAMDAAAEPEVAESQVAVDADVVEPAAVAEAFEEPLADAAAEAEDEAILDLVAFEMGAPDPQFDELPADEPLLETPAPAAAEVAAPVVAMAEPVAAEIDEPVIEEPLIAEPIAAEPVMPRTAATSAVATLERPRAQVAHVSPLPMPSRPPAPSLGATILASGILQPPRAPANDPLAPIRRMTQAEKVAFFS